MTVEKIYEAAAKVRNEFESQSVDRDLLWVRYCRWNPAAWRYDKNRYLDLAAASFPLGSCGLASAYLWGEVDVGEGQPKSVYYRGYEHTVLLGRIAMVDITADQFGGPRVYIGPMLDPWTDLAQS